MTGTCSKRVICIHIQGTSTEKKKFKRSRGGTRWRSWLRHCATSQKFAGSIPDGVIGIFHWHNPTGRTMALGSTQPLTEMSTRNEYFLGGKGGQCLGLTILPPFHVPIVLKSGSLNLLEPSGPVQACNGIALPFLQQWNGNFGYLKNLFFIMEIATIILIPSNQFLLISPAPPPNAVHCRC